MLELQDVLSISIPRSSPSASASLGMQTSLWRPRLPVCNLSSLVSSPLTLLATKTHSAIIMSQMALSSLTQDPHAHLCPQETHCSPQGLSHAALRVTCAQSCSPSPGLLTELPGWTKRTISHFFMVCILKILLGEMAFSFSFFLPFCSFTYVLPLFQLCH